MTLWLTRLTFCSGNSAQDSPNVLAQRAAFSMSGGVTVAMRRPVQWDDAVSQTRKSDGIQTKEPGCTFS